MDQAHVPVAVKDQQLAAFTEQQASFTSKVTTSFSDAIHKIFLVAGSLMLAALVAILFVKERKLRGGHDAAPGVE
jgi:hypothetical protein